MFFLSLLRTFMWRLVDIEDIYPNISTVCKHNKVALCMQRITRANFLTHSRLQDEASLYTPESCIKLQNPEFPAGRAHTTFSNKLQIYHSGSKDLPSRQFHTWKKGHFFAMRAFERNSNTVSLWLFRGKVPKNNKRLLVIQNIILTKVKEDSI